MHCRSTNCSSNRITYKLVNYFQNIPFSKFINLFLWLKNFLTLSFWKYKVDYFSDDMRKEVYCVWVKRKTLCSYLWSSFSSSWILPTLSGILGNSMQISILQTIKQTKYNSVNCSYKKETFRVYSFLE